MRGWQEDLLHITECEAGEAQVFEQVERAARSLGFQHCAYGLRLPVPLSNPRTVTLNNYPRAWQQRYAEAGYLHTDPTVLHGRQSQRALVWNDALFDAARQLWEEARSFGLRFGWAQSSLDANGVGGMLTLARSAEPLGVEELRSQELKMRWLVNVAHVSLSRVINAKAATRITDLTAREIEVLKWSADGKSAQDIASILAVSKNTIDFHVKNAVAKLQAANKTAAVVRAAMLGLLN